MKKLLLWVLVLTVSISVVLTFSVTGCKPVVEEAASSEEGVEEIAEEVEPDEEEPAEEETVEEVKEYEVVWLAPMEHIYWYYLRQGMEEIATKTLEEKGWKINITQMAPVAAYDITEQTTQFENMISKKVDAILLCPINEEALIPTIKEAYDADIAVVSVSAVILAEEVLTICQPYEVESCKNVAMYAIERHGSKGNCIVLFGMPGNITSEERQQGYEEGIAEFPDCEILDTQPVEFNKEKAMTVMENMLTKYPEIDFVFCCNDDAALGAYEAAAAVGRGDEIIFVGINGTIDGLNSILEERYDYTLFSDPFRLGRDSISALVELWSGNEVTKDQYRYILEVVDKDNAQSFLDIYPEMAKWYEIE